jgi:CubicO group peptidase (beta-lactamase class C family)
MTRLARYLAVVVLAVCVVPASAVAAQRDAFQRALATALREQPMSPGIVAAVDGPGLRWRGAAGVLDRASGSALRASDGYRIASITKTFTAAAVLRLAERGKLSLAVPVARYCPPCIGARCAVAATSPVASRCGCCSAHLRPGRPQHRGCLRAEAPVRSGASLDAS